MIDAPTCALRAGALAATLALTATLAAADVPAPGYQLATQPSPAAYAVTCSLPGGDRVTFDGLSVDRWSADGAYLGNLVTLPAFVFASFVTPAPDGSAVVIGESSNGDLLLVQADGSGSSPLVPLAYNYSAAWLPSGDLVVSAATSGLGMGNDLYRVELSPPSATLLGHVDGASGPVAVSPAGDLYYATQSDLFPPPPGATDVLMWSAAQVSAGSLSLQNAQTIGAGFEGGSSLAFDPVAGGLYLAETNFGLSLYRIVRVGPTPAASPVVIDQGAAYISDLEILRAGSSPGSFDPWQPEDGLLMRYNAGLELGTVRPRRPLLTASGPGTSGPGKITFQLTGGVPGGTMYIAACPRAHLLAQPVAYPLPTFLLVSAFTLSQTRRASGFLPLDANGVGTFVLSNPGTLQGAFGWQFLVGDAAGTFVGSTNQVQF